MRRVYLIWFFRKVFSPLGLKIAAPVVLLSCALYHVSCLDVLKNALISRSMTAYIYNSFLGAAVFDKIIFLGLIALFGAVAWDFFRKGFPAMLQGMR